VLPATDSRQFRCTRTRAGSYGLRGRTLSAAKAGPVVAFADKEPQALDLTRASWMSPEVRVPFWGVRSSVFEASTIEAPDSDLALNAGCGTIPWFLRRIGGISDRDASRLDFSFRQSDSRSAGPSPRHYHPKFDGWASLGWLSDIA
jgi:hypothetical protein